MTLNDLSQLTVLLFVAFKVPVACFRSGFCQPAIGRLTADYLLFTIPFMYGKGLKNNNAIGCIIWWKSIILAFKCPFDNYNLCLPAELDF